MNDNKKTVPLREAYTFASENGFSDEVAEIRSMIIEWNRSYTSAVRKGFMIRLLKENDLLSNFIESCWSEGDSPLGEKKINRLLRIASEYDDYVSGIESSDDDQMDQNESSFEFALEAHLRDFLAKDLERIEPGLKLYQVDGRTGVEYPIDGGRIDILAIDRAGRLVVIELKLSQGRNKALGQLLYYMGWVDSNMDSKTCRGIVIASDISPELSIAVSRAPDVSLYKYNMSFSVEPV